MPTTHCPRCDLKIDADSDEKALEVAVAVFRAHLVTVHGFAADVADQLAREWRDAHQRNLPQ